MGITGHGQTGHKFKGERCNLVDKTSSKGININTNVIEYVPKTQEKIEVQ